MTHLDICIDLETCGLGTNAAPMQLAAVAFDRTQLIESSDDDPAHRVIDNHPFLSLNEAADLCRGGSFNVGIDLRDCFFHGLQFDDSTQQWWQKQSEEARQAVISPSGGTHSLKHSLLLFSEWIWSLADKLEIPHTDITIWAQGSDFDIAKLREYYSRCGLSEPFRHFQARCARTFILENACLFMDPDAALQDPKKVYARLVDLPRSIGPSVTHDALYDSSKTAWYVWQVYQRLVSFSYGVGSER